MGAQIDGVTLSRTLSRWHASGACRAAQNKSRPVLAEFAPGGAALDVISRSLWFYVHARISTHGQGDVADIVEIRGNRGIRPDWPGAHGFPRGDHEGFFLKRRDGKFDCKLVTIRKPLNFLSHAHPQVHDFVVHLSVFVDVYRELRPHFFTHIVS